MKDKLVNEESKLVSSRLMPRCGGASRVLEEHSATLWRMTDTQQLRTMPLNKLDKRLQRGKRHLSETFRAKQRRRLTDSYVPRLLLPVFSPSRERTYGRTD